MNADDTRQAFLSSLDPKINLIQVSYCDLGGILRGKAVSRATLERRLQEGIGFPPAMLALTSVETIASVKGLGSMGEFRLLPDPSTFLLPLFQPGIGSLLGNLQQLDGSPWALCPRTFLQRMQARLAEEGMQMHVGTEHEFYLVRREVEGDGRYVPADSAEKSRIFTGLACQPLFLSTLIPELERQQLPLELLHAEAGPSQFELSLTQSEALQAADRVCHLRKVVRGVAQLYEVEASFAPKPFLAHFGSGLHLHVSLWQAGDNCFSDAEQPGTLSQLAHWFLAGIMEHLPGLLALLCACPNSYDRLQPHAWSSAYICWGYDNREAAIRVPSPYLGREAASTNLEIKCADHSANPYLVLGSILAAGLDGITQHKEPGEPLQIDPAILSEAEREQRGIARLPTTLGEALSALEQDTVLLEALGEDLSAAYLVVKRAECAFFEDLSPEQRAAHALTTY